MSVKTVDNTPKLSIDSKRNASLGLRFILDAIDRTAGPKTPKRDGNLRRDISKQVLGLRGTITWRKGYAGYQENKQYRNYTTPGTGPHFAQNAVKEVAADAVRYFKQAGLL